MLALDRGARAAPSMGTSTLTLGHGLLAPPRRRVYARRRAITTFTSPGPAAPNCCGSEAVRPGCRRRGARRCRSSASISAATVRLRWRRAPNGAAHRFDGIEHESSTACDDTSDRGRRARKASPLVALTPGGSNIRRSDRRRNGTSGSRPRAECEITGTGGVVGGSTHTNVAAIRATGAIAGDKRSGASSPPWRPWPMLEIGIAARAGCRTLRETLVRQLGFGEACRARRHGRNRHRSRHRSQDHRQASAGPRPEAECGIACPPSVPGGASPRFGPAGGRSARAVIPRRAGVPARGTRVSPACCSHRARST